MNNESYTLRKDRSLCPNIHPDGWPALQEFLKQIARSGMRNLNRSQSPVLHQHYFSCSWCHDEVRFLRVLYSYQKITAKEILWRKRTTYRD